jgi:hypothetical protein
LLEKGKIWFKTKIKAVEERVCRTTLNAKGEVRSPGDKNCTQPERKRQLSGGKGITGTRALTRRLFADGVRNGGLYWDRTSDPFHVKEVLYR